MPYVVGQVVEVQHEPSDNLNSCGGHGFYAGDKLIILRTEYPSSFSMWGMEGSVDCGCSPVVQCYKANENIHHAYWISRNMLRPIKTNLGNEFN